MQAAFTDADAGEVLTYSLSGTLGSGSDGAVSWLSLDSSTGALTIASAPDDAEVGTWTITITAADGGEDSASPATTTFKLTVSNVNDPPRVSSTVPTATAIAENAVIGTEVTSSAVTSLFSDADAGDVLTYKVFGKRGEDAFTEQAWLEVSGTDGKVEVATVPDDAEVGSWTLRIRASDRSGATADSQSFALMVSNVNDVPVVASPLRDLAILAGSGRGEVLVSADVLGGVFTDADMGAVLTYSFSGTDGSSGDASAWLEVAGDALQQKSDQDAPAGVWTVTLTADDGQGGVATDEFKITASANASPQLDMSPTGSAVIAKDATLASSGYSFSFSDADGEDTLSFTATLRIDGNADGDFADTGDSTDIVIEDFAVGTTAATHNGVSFTRTGATSGIVSLSGAPDTAGIWSLTLTASDRFGSECGWASSRFLCKSPLRPALPLAGEASK